MSKSLGPVIDLCCTVCLSLKQSPFTGELRVLISWAQVTCSTPGNGLGVRESQVPEELNRCRQQEQLVSIAGRTREKTKEKKMTSNSERVII